MKRDQTVVITRRSSEAVRVLESASFAVAEVGYDTILAIRNQKRTPLNGKKGVVIVSWPPPNCFQKNRILTIVVSREYGSH